MTYKTTTLTFTAAICGLLLVTLAVPVLGQAGLNDFPPETNTIFDSSVQFATSNGLITFADGGSYANATLNGDVWDFEGLFVNGGLSVLPNTNGVRFSVSSTNADITITHLDVLNMAPPAPGKLEYSVSGVGSQTFNLHYARIGLINWTVYIDGTAKAKGDGWTASPDGWLNVTGAINQVSINWKQPATITFAVTDTFQIPDFNGTIKFNSEGTCWGEPVYQNGTWMFQNLAINGAIPGAVMWSFAGSAQNCAITITGYNPGGLTGCTNVASWLNYTVTGSGVQQVNLNYNSNGYTSEEEMQSFVVNIDEENRTAGDGWRVLDNGWIEVLGAELNVSIYRPPNVFNGPPPRGVPTIYWQPQPTTTPESAFVNEVSSTPVCDGTPASLLWWSVMSVVVGAALVSIIVGVIVLVKRQASL